MGNNPSSRTAAKMVTLMISLSRQSHARDTLLHLPLLAAHTPYTHFQRRCLSVRIWDGQHRGVRTPILRRRNGAVNRHRQVLYKRSVRV